MEKTTYQDYVKNSAKKSNLLKDCFWAFIVGGLICLLGQWLLQILMKLSIPEESSKKLVSISLIFLSCLFTGIGIFDRLAKLAGAGTLVPITGFANAMCSPAIDCKAEGFILGVGAKMFVIAGPVIVYGVSASVVYGLIYWICTLI